MKHMPHFFHISTSPVDINITPLLLRLETTQTFDQSDIKTKSRRDKKENLTFDVRAVAMFINTIF